MDSASAVVPGVPHLNLGVAGQLGISDRRTDVARCTLLSLTGSPGGLSAESEDNRNEAGVEC